VETRRAIVYVGPRATARVALTSPPPSAWRQAIAWGASGNFGASEQWAGRVFSVICQVHTKIFVPVKTVPILDAFRLRKAHRNEPPDLRMAACAEIGPVCPSGRALQRIDRVKGVTLVANSPGTPHRVLNIDSSKKLQL